MDLEKDRERLLKHLRREIEDERVLDVMSRVRRELFVSAEGRRYAYDDRPLPIGQGQTISQPFIVALMTQAMELTGDETVLELGTGCGYQAAILAELCKKVVTVERIETLVRTSRRTLKKLASTPHNLATFLYLRNVMCPAFPHTAAETASTPESCLISCTSFSW